MKSGNVYKKIKLRVTLRVKPMHAGNDFWLICACRMKAYFSTQTIILGGVLAAYTKIEHLFHICLSFGFKKVLYDWDKLQMWLLLLHLSWFYRWHKLGQSLFTKHIENNFSCTNLKLYINRRTNMRQTAIKEQQEICKSNDVKLKGAVSIIWKHMLWG